MTNMDLIVPLFVHQRNLWRYNMIKDPIVEEVRKVRHQIEKEFGNDVKKHIEHIYQEQRKHSERLVSRQPRMLKRKKAA